MFYQIKSAFYLAISVFGRAKGLKNKTKILNYFFLNTINKFFKKIKLPKEIFIETRDFKFWFASSKSELSPYLEICHNLIYEKDKRFIPRREDIVFDIGGHIGFFALLQAKCIQKGKIFVFEPNPDAFLRLVKNIQVNGFENIYPINKAVTFREGYVRLYLSQNSSEGASIMEQKTLSSYDEEIEVKTISLDKVVKDYKIPKIQLMKIDVEGSEIEVLKSGLTKALPITEKIVIETHGTILKDEVKKILGGLKFQIVLEIPSGKSALGENNILYFLR